MGEEKEQAVNMNIQLLIGGGIGIMFGILIAALIGIFTNRVINRSYRNWTETMAYKGRRK